MITQYQFINRHGHEERYVRFRSDCSTLGHNRGKNSTRAPMSGEVHQRKTMSSKEDRAPEVMMHWTTSCQPGFLDEIDTRQSIVEWIQLYILTAFRISSLKELPQHGLSLIIQRERHELSRRCLLLRCLLLPLRSAELVGEEITPWPPTAGAQ